jgi:hypothetical protein
MLGDVDSKETRVVVESSSSDANAELETPLSSVSEGTEQTTEDSVIDACRPMLPPLACAEPEA